MFIFLVQLGAGGRRDADSNESLTLYSGQGEAPVAPLIKVFEMEAGIKVNVRYSGTSELAVLLTEEGLCSPADIFWAQDARALGALSGAGLLAELSGDLNRNLPEIYTSASRRNVR